MHVIAVLFFGPDRDYAGFTYAGFEAIVITVTMSSSQYLPCSRRGVTSFPSKSAIMLARLVLGFSCAGIGLSVWGRG